MSDSRTEAFGTYFPGDEDEQTRTHQLELDPKVQQLFEKLIACKIVEVETCATIARAEGAAHDVAVAINALQRAGKLTPFQADRLRNGTPDSLLFNEYVLLDRLGAGGMGEVFKGRDLRLGRVVAIKTILTAHEHNTDLTNRFLREAQLLASLRHRHMVEIYEGGKFGDTRYLVMQYVEGDDMRGKVEKANAHQEFIEVETICTWLQQACQALAVAHQNNVIHRDVKPGNLMIANDGRLYVLDLGIARLADPLDNQADGLTKKNHGLGTPEFMPSEQWIDATEVTPASDVYALGCTLFYALTGKVPFARKKLSDLHRAHQTEPPPRLRELRPDIPEELEQIVFRCLAKKPHERYPSAAELAAALQPFAAQAPARARPIAALPMGEIAGGAKPPAATTAYTAPRSRGRKLVLGAAGALLLVGIGGVGWWQWGRSPGPTSSEQASAKGAATTDAASPVAQPPVTTSATSALAATAPQQADPRETRLAEEVQHYPQAWRDVAQLRAALAGLPLADLSPADQRNLLERELPALTKRRLLLVEAEQWLRTFAEQHAAAWPDALELQQFADAVYPRYRLEDQSQWEAVRQAVTKETAARSHPFADLRLEKLSSEQATRAREALPALQALTALHAVPPDPSWKFSARLALNGEKIIPLERMHVGESAYLTFTTNKPTYITPLMIDDQGIFILKVAKQWEREADGSRTVLLREPAFTFGTPGTKRVYVYATARPVVPASLPDVVQWDMDDPRQLEAVFASLGTWGRIRQAIAQATPLPGVEVPKPAGLWTRAVVEISVEP